MSGNVLKESLKYLKEVTLLYVEDDLSTQDEISFFLKNRVKEIYVASDGEEGLKLFKEHRPDIVLSDIQMPKMNGLEMIFAIKEIDEKVPVIISTAFNDSSYLFKAIDIGISKYLTKPVDLMKLVKLLSKISEEINLKNEVQTTHKFLEQYQKAIEKNTLLTKVNKDGVVIYISDRFSALIGYDKNELIGKNEKILWYEDSMQNEKYKQMHKNLTQKKIWEGVTTTKTKTGGSFISDIIGFPILDENDEIIEHILIRNDVTELVNYRKILQNQLNQNKNSLKEKIHFLNEYQKATDQGTAVCRISTDGNIDFVNDTFMNLLKCSQEDLIDVNYFDIFTSNKSDKIILSNEFSNKLYSKKVFKITIKHNTKENKAIYLNATYIPILDVRGSIVEIVSMHSDITEIVELNKEIVDTQKELLCTLGEVAESRSNETGNHIKRVAEYSYILAKNAGYEKDADLIKIASPMHDIGKIGIEDSILNKPAKLTDEEYEKIKEHSQMGYEIFKNSERSILKTSAIIARDHHEKWDGSGYPNGLQGADIHIYGRIVAIADVFDALASDRVYKKAWEVEKVLDYFKEQRGKHFDPELIDIFFKHIDEILEIKESYKD